MATVELVSRLLGYHNCNFYNESSSMNAHLELIVCGPLDIEDSKPPSERERATGQQSLLFCHLMLAVGVAGV